MKFNFKLTVAALCISFFVKSQNAGTGNSATEVPVTKRGCGTAAPTPEWNQWFNKKVVEYKDQRASAKSANLVSLTIPVIVHVIHGGQNVGTFPNISVAQIKSQIAVLNKDFAGNGYNSYYLAATGFSAVGIANTKISFCLAQFDPAGNPLSEPGIERVNYISEGWTNPATPTGQTTFQNLIDGTIKPATIWDPTYYFNIWVTDINNNVGILGYATFPGGSGLAGLPFGGSASTDGIWVWSRSFGNTGTLSFPYNQGRTATHETGHWLGLRHIGGDATNPAGDCNATDYCDDTPPQKGGFSGGSNGQNFGGPTYPLHVNVCGSPYGDMFMNFMDYTDDAFNYMFTPDQNDRIQTAMTNGTYRNQLNTSSANLCVGLPFADYILDTIACASSNINPLNQTTGAPLPTYSWTVKPSAGVIYVPNNTDANPIIQFPSAGVYTLTLIASNSIGMTSSSSMMYINDCVGLNEPGTLGSAVRLAPNPSSGMVTVRAELPEGQNFSVIVHNSLGQLVILQEQNAVGSMVINLNLTALPDGVYSVTISSGAEKSVKRLILNK